MAIDFVWLGSVIGFAVAMSATPGPNNMMVAASGANHGFRATLSHIAGITIGFALMMAVLGTVGLPLLTDARIHAVLKWAGIAYLLWLAWALAASVPAPTRDTPPERGVATPAAIGRPLGFWAAAAFQWVNPKAWIIAAGALATYGGNGSGATPLATTLLLAAIFGGMSILACSLWTAIGLGAGRLLATPAAMRRFNIAMAALLVASLIPLLRE